MIRGMYSATAGMITMLSRVQTIANNLANVDTPGYREDTLRLTSFPQMLMARMFNGGAGGIGGDTALVGQTTMGGIVNESMAVRLTQASLRATDNPLDLAIQGAGFFSVQTRDGVRYTRDGSFRRDGANQLVTSQGDLVLGANGTPIALPPGEVVVLPTGQIQVNGQAVGQVGVVEFAEPDQLKKVANNLLEDASGQAQPGPAANSVVQQGYLEGSNVDPTRAMADMMVAQRAYESNARMVQIQDDMTQRAVNDVGRV
jgi:flagellar basal-body rod protein FlgG